MKSAASFILAFCLCLCTLLPAFAQDAAGVQQDAADTIAAKYQVFSQYLAPEKLFLHVDRKVYCLGETIWLCGYLKNASQLAKNPESNYIYVELFRPDGTLENRIKLKRSGKSFPGEISLAEDIPSGTYTLRAYALSQLGRSPEYMFHQEIRILGSEKRAAKDKAGKEDIDVTFYPEGGRCFDGLPSRVAFKVMDSKGRSVEAEGKVVDASGELVATVATRHDGMGDFSFIPLQGDTYTLVLSSGQSFSLPQVSPEGASVSIVELTGRYAVHVYGSLRGSYRLLLRDASRIMQLATFEDIDGQAALLVQADAVSSGINHLLLTDSRGKIISERLFYKYGSDVPNASVSLKADGALSPRQPLSLNIGLCTQDGSPLEGTCSISVLKGSLSPYVQDDGIVSYMGLSSELRGTINDPFYYFDSSVPQKERSRNMDLLMMVQGWSYYALPSLLDASTPVDTKLGGHRREYTQFIKGKVSRLLLSKAPTNFTMAVLVPSKDITIITPVEEGKSFIIDSLDIDEGTGMMIKVSRDGHGADYIPEWDGDEFAKEYKYTAAPGSAGQARESIDLKFENSTDTLEAAVVVGKAENILGINGVEVSKRDFKIFSHMNLVDYIIMHEPSFKYENGQMSNQRNSLLTKSSSGLWSDSPVVLLVDGTPAAWEAFENISMSEIESISISKQADMIYRATDGVVAINLNYGVRVTSLSESEPSLLYFTPLGYQVPEKFYSPRYDKGDVGAEQDRRNTIFWNPSVQVRSGKATATFCTSDEEDYPYAVQIEGVTSDGRVFSVRKSLND